jgi:hypothetical protein
LSTRTATMLYYFRHCSNDEKLFSPFNVVQTPDSIPGVKLLAIAFSIGAACLFFHSIGKATGQRMADGLNERRKKYANPLPES